MHSGVSLKKKKGEWALTQWSVLARYSSISAMKTRQHFKIKIATEGPHSLSDKDLEDLEQTEQSIACQLKYYHTHSISYTASALITFFSF